MFTKIGVVALIAGALLSFGGGCRKEGQPEEGSPSDGDAGGHMEAGPQIGEEAPTFSLNDVEGKTVDIAALIGQKTLALVFWGTWCDVCKGEIPVLKKMQSTHGEKGFQILSVAVKQTPDQPDAEFQKEVAEFTETEKLNFMVLLDPEYEAVALYHLHGVPTISVIDIQGNIRYTGHSADDAEAIVKKLLAS